MLVAAAASAGAIGATATHWGSFFGGDVHDKLLSPTAIKLPGRVVEVASSNSDEYALLADGAVYAWGLGGEGELRNGGTADSLTVAVRVAFLPLAVTQVAEGGSFTNNGQTLVMLSDGTMRSWGDNEWGQLGDHRSVNQPSPISFHTPSGVTYKVLATGAETSYAVSAGGRLYSWGNGGSGQIGNGRTTRELRPQMIESGVQQISSTANNIVTRH